MGAQPRCCASSSFSSSRSELLVLLAELRSRTGEHEALLMQQSTQSSAPVGALHTAAEEVNACNARLEAEQKLRGRQRRGYHSPHSGRSSERRHWG